MLRGCWLCSTATSRCAVSQRRQGSCQPRGRTLTVCVEVLARCFVVVGCVLRLPVDVL